MEKMKMKKLALANDLIGSPVSSLINTPNSESNDAKNVLTPSTNKMETNGANLTPLSTSTDVTDTTNTPTIEAKLPKPDIPIDIYEKVPVENGLPKPVRSIECFKIIKQIGEGTYGQVYKAKDTDNW